MRFEYEYEYEYRCAEYEAPSTLYALRSTPYALSLETPRATDDHQRGPHLPRSNPIAPRPGGPTQGRSGKARQKDFGLKNGKRTNQEPVPLILQASPNNFRLHFSQNVASDVRMVYNKH
jgi:hypothetical protein